MGTLRAVWRLLLNPTLIALWPIFFLTGFELSFWTGEFPQLLDPKIIGLVMVGAGVGDAVGGFVIGAVSDRIGRSAGVVMGTIFYAFGLYFTVVLQRNPHETDHQLCVQSYCAPWSAWCAAVFLGLGDSGFNTQVYALLGQLYPVGMDSVASFVIFQLWQNIGSLVGYYYAIPVPVHGPDGTLTQIWCQCAVLGLSLVGFLFVDIRRRNRLLREATESAVEAIN